MARYLTWRNILGVLLLAILVMIWPLELIGWYSLHTYMNGSPASKINAITGHVSIWVPPHPQSDEEIVEESKRGNAKSTNVFDALSTPPYRRKVIQGHWEKAGW